VVTYYLGPSAHITERTFEVRTPGSRIAYDVRDLRDVRCGSTGPDQTGIRYGGVCAVSLVAVAASWTQLGSPQEWVVAAVFVAAPGILSLVCLRTRPPLWTLHAHYRGHRVQLYASSDSRQFNQVMRGLTRALERWR
jgi:hypothetical protein